jgi:RNA polymerase sigma factor (sigma-70 family)
MSHREAGDADEVGDSELVQQVRDGVPDAAGVLWERHARASRAAARRITRAFDSDDLVQEAFTRTLSAIRGGRGPTGPFRPYLYASIRNIAASWSHRGSADPIEEAHDVADPTSDFGAASLDRILAARAFRTLPEEWRTVLWYADVEGMGAKDIAPLTGLTPGAVASLTYRAREGLRRAWIQAHISDALVDDDCRWAVERIPGHLRGSLSRAHAARMRDHLAGCARCTLLVEELEDVAERLRVILLPLVLGAGVTSLDGAGEAEGNAASLPLPELGGTKAMRSRASIGLLASVGGIAAAAASITGLWYLTTDEPNGLVEAGSAELGGIESPSAPRADAPRSISSPEPSAAPSPGPTAVPDVPPADADDTNPDEMATGRTGPVDRGLEAGPDPNVAEPVGPGPDLPGPDEAGSGEPNPADPDTAAPDPGGPDPEEPEPAEPGSGAPDPDTPGPIITDVVRDHPLSRVYGSALPGALVEAVTTRGEVLGRARAGDDGTFVLVIELSSPLSTVRIQLV